MSKVQKVLLVIALGVLLAAGLAFGEGRNQGLAPTGQIMGYKTSAVDAAYRSSIAVLDTADATHADIIAIEKIYCGGYTTLAVSAHMSAASATARIRVVRYTTADAVKSYSASTATADDADTDGTNYLAPTLYFDTEGAPYVRVLTDAPSSGTVTLWTEVN